MQLNWRIKQCVPVLSSLSCIPVCVKRVYSLGKGNIAADALSRMPSDKTANMETYAEIVPRDVLQVVARTAESQDQN